MWLSRLACSFLCSTQSNLFRPNSAESASFRQIPTHSGELKSILANSSECAQFSRIQPNPIYFGRIPLHFADWNPIQINFSEHGRINPLQLKVSPNLPNTGEGPEVWRCRSTLACVRGCFLPKVPHTSEPRAPPNSAMTFFWKASHTCPHASKALRTLLRTLLRSDARFFFPFHLHRPNSAEFRRIQLDAAQFRGIRPNQDESTQFSPIPPNSAESGQANSIQPNSAEFSRIRPNQANSTLFNPIPPNSAESGQFRPIHPNSAEFRRIQSNSAESGQFDPNGPNSAKLRRTGPNQAISAQFNPIHLWVRSDIHHSQQPISSLYVSYLWNFRPRLARYYW